MHAGCHACNKKMNGVKEKYKNQPSQFGFDNYVISEYAIYFGLQGHHHVVVFIKTLKKLHSTNKIHEKT
jgi:hypothetical protein